MSFAKVGARAARIRRRLGLRLVVERNRDYRRSVFVAGTGRSGTTWLSEIINHRNDHRYIFEPFSGKRLACARAFGEKRYMRPDAAPDPVLLDTARTILTGRIRSAWTERFNQRLIADRRIIKAIRANLMLKWLHVHFPEMPMVLILRHPCATAYSYWKHGWRGAIEPFLRQEGLVDDHLRPFAREIERADDRLMKAALVWAVETLVPLRQFRPGEIHVMFYENLVRNPEGEVHRLFSYLGREYDFRAVTNARRPSATSRKNSAVCVGSDPIERWRAEIGADESRRILEIVKLFGLDGIYGEDPMPNATTAQEILALPFIPGGQRIGGHRTVGRELPGPAAADSGAPRRRGLTPEVFRISDEVRGAPRARRSAVRPPD